jgi:RNA polymerase sigma-70 factor (ECF subfamily)
MSESPGTRASLLVRLRDPEDAASWNLFVDLYAPLIYGFFRRQGLQDADAADLTQEVLARVSQGIRRLDYDPARGTFRGWLFTVVRNRWRSWAARPQLPRENALLDDQPAPHEDREWENDYRRRLLAWAADQVRPTVAAATWQAFWATGIEGHGAAETARELGLSVAAVYMAKSRVLARLKEVLREADGLGLDL